MTGKLRPGDRVPSENELARQYGVTPLTVRHGQRPLVQEGLIRKERGSGTYVTAQARRHRRALLVCGLLHPARGSSAAMASPYYLHAIEFCHQAAAASGLPLETVWIQNYPVERTALDAPDPATGYIFLACDLQHPLVQRAAAEGAHHVYLGRVFAAERAVWFDVGEAGRLAWEQLRHEVTRRQLSVGVVSVQGESAGVQMLAQWVPGGILHVAGPNSFTAWEAEQWSYQAIRRMCAGADRPGAWVFLDDTLARGGTRALLEAGLGDGRCPVVVVSGKREVAPCGLPVTYVVHDDEAEARWAVEMLLAQIEGHDGGIAPRKSPFVTAVLQEEPAPTGFDRQRGVTEARETGAEP